MSMYELVSEWHIETDADEPDPVVEKVLRDITLYRDGLANIYIDGVLWLFNNDRMWKPDNGKEWVGKDVIHYDANGVFKP